MICLHQNDVAKHLEAQTFDVNYLYSRRVHNTVGFMFKRIGSIFEIHGVCALFLKQGMIRKDSKCEKHCSRNIDRSERIAFRKNVFSFRASERIDQKLYFQ